MSLAWTGIGKQYLSRYLEPLRVLGRRNIDLRIAPPRLDLDFSDIFWLHNVILIGKVDGRKSFDAGGRFCLAIASGLTRAQKKAPAVCRCYILQNQVVRFQCVSCSRWRLVRHRRRPRQ